jgi:hypothetical protein
MSPSSDALHAQAGSGVGYRTTRPTICSLQRPGRLGMEKKESRHGGVDFNLEPCSCRSEPPKSGEIKEI